MLLTVLSIFFHTHQSVFKNSYTFYTFAMLYKASKFETKPGLTPPLIQGESFNDSHSNTNGNNQHTEFYHFLNVESSYLTI